MDSIAPDDIVIGVDTHKINHVAFACDGLGRAYGPAELVALVQGDCHRDATMPPDGETGTASVGTWLVWIGMVALVLLGVGSVHAR